MEKKMYGKTWSCKKTSAKHVSCKLKKPATKKRSSKKGTPTRKIKGGKASHLGHRTKRGLAQDQKLKSQEAHEVAYRKGKRK